MNGDQTLNQVVNKYKAQGYQVVVRPGPDALPSFAKDFQVEILAKRDDGNVLASAKKNSTELEADSNAPRYAEIIGRQPGWRFDIFILEAESPLAKLSRAAKEPSDAELRKALADVETMLRAGYLVPPFTAAWSVLEALMRRKLRASGQDGAWDISPRAMLNELYSDGVFPVSIFRKLEDLYLLRNELVHGFVAEEFQPSAVQFMVDTARTLLNEPEPAKQSA